MRYKGFGWIVCGEASAGIVACAATQPASSKHPTKAEREGRVNIKLLFNGSQAHYVFWEYIYLINTMSITAIGKTEQIARIATFVGSVLLQEADPTLDNLMCSPRS